MKTFIKNNFIFLLLFICFQIKLSAQTEKLKTDANKNEIPQPKRAISQSDMPSSKPIISEAYVKTYDENAPFMGRTEEFLNQMTVTKLPEDFPKYNKAWSLADYNAVVDVYYTTHLNILKERTKLKAITPKN